MTRPPGDEMHQPELWVCRHGETEWSRDGRHTSRTDLPLTDIGVAQARRLRTLLAGVRFDLVLTSPLRRARDTATAAGFPGAEPDPEVVEWDYGDYEGRTTPDIRGDDPGWTVWTHLSPGGESIDEVAARTDRVIARVRSRTTERALLFAHGHVLRVLAARWVDLPPVEGRRLALATGTVSVLAWEREWAAVRHWNAASLPEPPRHPR